MMNHCFDKKAMEDLYHELTNLGSWPGGRDFEEWYQERFEKELAKHERKQAKKSSTCGLTEVLKEMEG